MQAIPKREIVMFKKAMFCGMVYGLASAGVFGQQVAGDEPAPSKPSLIVAVDVDGLARTVFPKSTAVATQPRFRFPGVERSYQHPDTGELFNVIVGVYPSVDDAKRALMRTAPQFARIIPERPGDDSGRISGGAAVGSVGRDKRPGHTAHRRRYGRDIYRPGGGFRPGQAAANA